jgi:DNA-binding IclR family transcriptional regulator
MPTASSRYIFAILRLVSTAERPLSATEISRSLDLSTTTAHRGLTTLERAGYVARHQLSARYVLGVTSRRLLHSLFARFALHGFAIPYMRQLAIATGETVSLFVQVGWYAVRIASVKGTKEIIHTGPVGEVRDLDDGVAGRALLAFLPEAERERFLAARGRAPSAAGRRALDAELADIRASGVATEASAAQPGWAAVAFALRSGAGAGVAAGAIAIEGPVLKLGGRRRSAEWTELATSVAQMEALIRANPARFRNPYGHLDPAGIELPSVTARRSDRSDRRGRGVERRGAATVRRARRD